MILARSHRLHSDWHRYTFVVWCAVTLPYAYTASFGVSADQSLIQWRDLV